MRERLLGPPAGARTAVRRRRQLRDGQVPGRHGFEAFTNARGVLYHSPRLDPGVKYPPYAEHTRERKVMDKLL